MEPLQAQLLLAWQIHESKNVALLSSVKQAGLESTLSTRGGIVLPLKQSKNPLSKDDYWKLWGWSKGRP